MYLYLSEPQMDYRYISLLSHDLKSQADHPELPRRDSDGVPVRYHHRSVQEYSQH